MDEALDEALTELEEYLDGVEDDRAAENQKDGFHVQDDG